MIEKVIEMTEKVADGNAEALSTYIELHKLSKAIKEAMDEIKEQTIEEAGVYGKGEHEVNGSKFQIRAGAGRYSYKHLEWDAKYREMQKDAQEAFKAAEKGRQYITDDGEVVEPAEYTNGKETIAIKI